MSEIAAGWTDEERVEALLQLDTLWTLANAAGLNADAAVNVFRATIDTGIPFTRWENRLLRVTSTL